MKRILLREPADLGKFNLPLVRRASVAIATWAVDGKKGRPSGDPIHEWVTEGRRLQFERALAAGCKWAVQLNKTGGYSSCGDLIHFVLMLLGMRDEKVLNRGDDGGDLAWRMCVNISKLVRSRYYVGANTYEMPMLGDMLHVAPPDHVSVLTSVPMVDQWVDANYGAPHGAQHVRPLRNVAQGMTVGGRLLGGFVSLEKVVGLGGLVESAIVPDDFVGGLVDDSPYPEDLVILAGL